MTRPTALATLRLAVMVSLAGCSSAKVEIDAAVDKLRSRQCDGSLPVCLMPEGEVVNWGNVGDGPRNLADADGITVQAQAVYFALRQ
jgi:hypothetical protein